MQLQVIRLELPAILKKPSTAGGATGSLESLQHAMQGAAIALPAAVIKYTGWSEEVHRRVPILEDIHEVEASRMRPLLTGITPQQVSEAFSAMIGSLIWKVSNLFQPENLFHSLRLASELIPPHELDHLHERFLGQCLPMSCTEDGSILAGCCGIVCGDHLINPATLPCL